MVASEKKIIIKNGSEISLRSPFPVDAKKLLKHLRTVFHESYRRSGSVIFSATSKFKGK